MNRSTRSLRPALLAACAMAMLGAGPARGGLTVSFDFIIPIGPDVFLWEYDASIAASDELRAGDFFVVYDFAGYVPGSIFATDPDFTAVAELLTAAPPTLTQPPDRPDVFNLVFTYIGVPLGGPFVFQGFLADTEFSDQVAGDFISRVTLDRPGDITDGTDVDTRGSVPVPRGVPEPSTLLLGGLAGVGWLARRRRRPRGA